jgi:hypothetical protein
MHFQIRETRAAVPWKGTIVTKYNWTLEKKEGVVCKSATFFDSEKEARSDIAAAKRSMRAAGRCRVQSPDEENPPS